MIRACEFCKVADTLDEDEAYCGTDCAVDHAHELRGEVDDLSKRLQLVNVLYRNWKGKHIAPGAFVSGMNDALDDVEYARLAAMS